MLQIVNLSLMNHYLCQQKGLDTFILIDKWSSMDHSVPYLILFSTNHCLLMLMRKHLTIPTLQNPFLPVGALLNQCSSQDKCLLYNPQALCWRHTTKPLSTWGQTGELKIWIQLKLTKMCVACGHTNLPLAPLVLVWMSCSQCMGVQQS